MSLFDRSVCDRLCAAVLSLVIFRVCGLSASYAPLFCFVCSLLFPFSLPLALSLSLLFSLSSLSIASESVKR